MIGIITRKDKSPTSKDIYVAYKSINDIIISYDEIGIGILPNNMNKMKPILNKCSGIILEGGDDFTLLDLEIIKYLYEKDIPCLGICLGMQSMAYLFDGKIGHLINDSHNSKDKYVHEICINKSKIYKNNIVVNSRHKDYVINTKLDVTGRSRDNIIEMIEDNNKTFFVGVQWHPEDINDENSKLLFDIFFNNTKKNK